MPRQPRVPYPPSGHYLLLPPSDVIDRLPPIAKDLLTYRIRAGFPQGVVARRAGIQQSDMSSFEHARAVPSTRMIARIKAAIDELVADAERAATNGRK